MASSTFKNFLNATKKTTRVIGPVERHLLTRPRDVSRSTTVLHPSEMVRDDWCYRASYYLLKGEEPAPEPANRRGIKTQLVFGEGHAIHGLWQSWFGGMGGLYGVWKCVTCGIKFWDVSPQACNACQGVKLRYAEVPIISEELCIGGSADGWLIGFGDDLMLEIKSVGEGSFRFEDPHLWDECGRSFEAGWKALTKPFPKHEMQIQLYMAILDKYPNPDINREVPNEAVVLYQSKANQDVKEFIIPKNNQLVRHLLSAAEMVVESVAVNQPPVCNVGRDGSCSKCEVYNED